MKPLTYFMYPLVMAVIYFATGVFSLTIFSEHSIITMSAFFPEGFALAGILLFGLRVLPGIFLGQLLLALYSGFPLPVSIGISLGNTLEAYIALRLFNYFNLDTHLYTLKDLFGILGLIIIVLQPFSAITGNTILYMSGILDIRELPQNIFYWWIGNVLGQMLLTPMLLLLYHNKSKTDPNMLVVVSIVTVVMNYLFQVAMQIDNPSLLLALTLPVTIYLSTLNINYASISSVLLATVSLYFAHKGIGTFSHDPSIINNLLNLNYFMLSHIVLVLLVGILFREKEEAIEQLKKMAHIDALTGLPNRHMLREEIHHAVSLSDEYGDKGAICYIDIDNFKLINDASGHHTGDEVLKSISSRIVHEITARDALLRIGGDELVLILNKAENRQMTKEILQRVMKSIQRPLTIEGHTLHVTCSIGVAFCPDHGTTVKELMETADKAMYMAKVSGRDNIVIAE